jgi:hypothetical protein
MDIQLYEAIMVLRKGYTKQQSNDRLTDYESLDITQQYTLQYTTII